MDSERTSTIGWREWVTLPAFSNTPVKAKVDTGAKTSSLHAQDLTVIEQGDHLIAQFEFYPEHDSDANMTLVTAPIIDFRTIRSSNGQTETRPVVRTGMRIAERLFGIDLTLTCRSSMGHRMLLGRRFLENKYQVDPGRSFLVTTKRLTEDEPQGIDSMTGELV